MLFLPHPPSPPLFPPVAKRRTCSLQANYWRRVKPIMVDGRSRYSCPYCEKSFSEKKICREHCTSIHLGQKHVCECGKEFNWKKSFKKHMFSTGHMPPITLPV